MTIGQIATPFSSHNEYYPESHVLYFQQQQMYLRPSLIINTRDGSDVGNCKASFICNIDKLSNSPCQKLSSSSTICIFFEVFLKRLLFFKVIFVIYVFFHMFRVLSLSPYQQTSINNTSVCLKFISSTYFERLFDTGLLSNISLDNKLQRDKWYGKILLYLGIMHRLCTCEECLDSNILEQASLFCIEYTSDFST